MSNLWRFYDGTFSGVVVAWTEKEALEKAKLYLKIHFDGYEESSGMKVWPCKSDDDFDEAAPWDLAVSY